MTEEARRAQLLRHAIEVVRNHRDGAGRLAFGPEGEEVEALAPLTELLRRKQTTGELRDFDPRVMAMAVRRVIDRFSHELLPDPDVAAVTDEIVALFDHATCAEPDS